MFNSEISLLWIFFIWKESSVTEKAALHCKPSFSLTQMSKYCCLTETNATGDEMIGLIAQDSHA